MVSTSLGRNLFALVALEFHKVLTVSKLEDDATEGTTTILEFNSITLTFPNFCFITLNHFITNYLLADSHSESMRDEYVHHSNVVSGITKCNLYFLNLFCGTPSVQINPV